MLRSPESPDLLPLEPGTEKHLAPLLNLKQSYVQATQSCQTWATLGCYTGMGNFMVINN